MKNIKNILTAIIIVNLIISGIFIGAPIETTYRPIIVATMVLFGIYLLITKNNVKIIRNKIDIFIILLGVSTLVPLIFNTAVSITSEINYIFKYISAILLYICIREHLINYPDTRKTIINTIIALSIVLIILGMDNLGAKVFTKPLDLINIKIEEIEKNRLSSIFCYANSLAIIISISIMLNNLNYLEAQNKIKKGIYGVITAFLTMGLLLTSSRLVILFYVIFLALYMFLLKNKIKTYDLIKYISISFFMAFIYNSIFFNLINSEKYIILCFATACICLISFTLFYFSTGLEKKLERIKIKNIFIIVSIILVILIILVLNIKGNLDVFKNDRKEYELQFGNIRSNEEYIMDFEFGEIKTDENIQNFKIEVVEMDEFLDEISITNIDEKEFLNNKQIKIKMQETTKIVKVIFTKVNDNCKIIINNLNINGKNKVLDYKLLPDELEHRIQNTLMTQRGLYERKVFIEDGLKLIKENLLFGKGGNAWEYELYNYQQYYYVATQVHSYIIQVGIEYGIVGIIALILIIILIIIKYIKNKDKHNVQQISIITSILLLITHSCIDFEMTYLYVLQIFFILIAILFSFKTENNENRKQNSKIIKIIVSLFLFTLIIGYIGLRPYYDSSIKMNEIKQIVKESQKDDTQKENLDIKMMKYYEDYFNLERHYNITINYYFNYARIIQRNATEENTKETVEKLMYVYDIATKINPNFEIEYTLSKYNECNLIADKIRISETEDEELKNIAKDFYQLVLDGCKETKAKLEKDYKLYRKSKEEIKSYLERLNELYERIEKNITKVV